MNISKLVLNNFRSYSHLELEFPKGIILIQGENGLGKTNLAEAIYLTSIGRSWRSSEDRLLIKSGEEKTDVEITLNVGEVAKDIRIELSPSGKRALINGKPCKTLSELSGLSNVLLFSPEDVGLFTGPPAQRRLFLDINLGKTSKEYFEAIYCYNSLLKEKNAVLKQENPDKMLLNTLNEKIAEIIVPIVEGRTSYVASLNEILPGVARRLLGENAKPKLIYKPCVETGEEAKQRALTKLEESLPLDLERSYSTFGPHREDILALLNGKSLSSYGSQAQNRLTALALKLSPYYLVKEEEKKPIVVLDDIASELDAKRTENLIQFLEEFEQVFLTATQLDISNATIIDVKENTAIRRINHG